MWNTLVRGEEKKRKGLIALKKIYNLMVDRHKNNRREWMKIMEKIIAEIVCGISQLGMCKLKHLSYCVTNKCCHSWTVNVSECNFG